MTKETLLERAKRTKVTRQSARQDLSEEMEVALAYFNGEITFAQMRNAFNNETPGGTQVYVSFTRAVQELHAAGRIKIL